MLYGALEAGGTKMVLSIGNENNEILERTSIPTRNPKETIDEMNAWFAGKNICALGVGTFGPVELDENSPKYGWITTSPKLAWVDQPLLPRMQEALGVPALIDTDVNAAALAEYELGAAKGLKSCLYVTIGTGVGGGLIVEGNLVHGLMHPELGHILLREEPSDPTPDGFCPYHIGCLEGLASGPAIEKRWGVSAKELAQDHPAWDLEAAYLAQMCICAICTFSPEKIILGGGVMQQKHIFPKIRAIVQERLNRYIGKAEILENIDNYIVEPGLGTASGATGALLLAKKAYARSLNA